MLHDWLKLYFFVTTVIEVLSIEALHVDKSAEVFIKRQVRKVLVQGGESICEGESNSYRVLLN